MREDNERDIKYVPKGWGFEKWIVNCEEYCGKLSVRKDLDMAAIPRNN